MTGTRHWLEVVKTIVHRVYAEERARVGDDERMTADERRTLAVVRTAVRTDLPPHRVLELLRDAD